MRESSSSVSVNAWTTAQCPDVDGAVSSLVKYGAVTVAWVERLAAINEESVGFFDEELAELREGLSGA